jgi:hypothetical protein
MSQTNQRSAQMWLQLLEEKFKIRKQELIEKQIVKID